MKRQPLISKGSINRMLQAAADLWNRREFQQSIETMERALRLDPANAGLLLDLGIAYGQRYDYAAAERYIEKAIRFASAKTEFLALAGRRCCDLRNTALAEQYLKRALDQMDAPTDAFVRLAELYERSHRLDDATALIARALHANPNSGYALLARARLDRQAGRLEDAEKTVRVLLNQPDPGASQSPERDIRIRGWYELGAILDRQKRFDDAMAAFLEAKSMLTVHAGRPASDLEVVRARMKRMRDQLTAGMVQRWLDSGPELQPAKRLALLCGHPRSGTTLLEQVLDSHPDIVSAEETDVFYDEAYTSLEHRFSKDQAILPALESADITSLRQARDRYFQSIELSLGQPIGNRLLVDKNPILTLMIPAVVRVFPEVKLVVALRDPRDVVLSCFTQPLVPVAQVSSAYLTLAGTVEDYAAVMSIWQTMAPLLKDRWIEVAYEDMVGDLESVSRRVLDFVRVSWDPGVLRFDQHAREKIVRSPTYADVAKPVFKTAMGRWKNYGKYLEPHLAGLEQFVKAFGYE